MAKRDLYKISGHWDHYRDGMFIMGDPDDETKECFALRPMTCPFQYQVYLNRMRSYRDLPMRLGETSTLFRNEDSGEMHGLIRVRQFTISEGHLVLRPDQLEEEFAGCLSLAKYMLETVGWQFISTPTNTWGINSLPNEIIQRGNAVMSTLMQVGASFGTAAIVSLTAFGPLIAPPGADAAALTLSSYHAAFIGVAALFVVVLALVLVAIRDKQND
jgi:threonyl-tRNA synthetase